MTLKLDIALTGQTVSAHILFHLLNISVLKTNTALFQNTFKST